MVRREVSPPQSHWVGSHDRHDSFDCLLEIFNLKREDLGFTGTCQLICLWRCNKGILIFGSNFDYELFILLFYYEFGF